MTTLIGPPGPWIGTLTGSVGKGASGVTCTDRPVPRSATNRLPWYAGVVAPAASP